MQGGEELSAVATTTLLRTSCREAPEDINIMIDATQAGELCSLRAALTAWVVCAPYGLPEATGGAPGQVHRLHGGAGMQAAGNGQVCELYKADTTAFHSIRTAFSLDRVSYVFSSHPNPFRRADGTTYDGEPGNVRGRHSHGPTPWGSHSHEGYLHQTWRRLPQQWDAGGRGVRPLCMGSCTKRRRVKCEATFSTFEDKTRALERKGKQNLGPFDRSKVVGHMHMLMYI